MSLAEVLAFNLTLLVAIASPGPALIYALRACVSGGRRQGIFTGIGLGLMASLWTLAALLGLDQLFDLFPPLYLILKIAGLAYLLWIAYSTWKRARDPVAAAPLADDRAFWGGFLLNLGNPKSVLFAAAVLVVIFPSGLSMVEIGLITLNHFAFEVIFYSLLAVALASDAARARYLATKPILDRIAAVVLGGLGLRIFFSR